MSETGDFETTRQALRERYEYFARHPLGLAPLPYQMELMEAALEGGGIKLDVLPVRWQNPRLSDAAKREAYRAWLEGLDDVHAPFRDAELRRLAGEAQRLTEPVLGPGVDVEGMVAEYHRVTAFPDELADDKYLQAVVRQHKAQSLADVQHQGPTEQERKAARARAFWIYVCAMMTFTALLFAVVEGYR